MEPCTLAYEGAIAIATMDDGRANAIDERMLQALERSLAAAKDASCLVLRGREKVFCGGLDLPALTALDREGMSRFLLLFDRVHDALLSFPAPIVTVARGSAVAGGAILFASGDVRLTTPLGKVGINEAALGLNIPASALEILRVSLGERGVAEAAQTAALYSGEDRVRVGFATEIVEPEQIDARAMAHAAVFAANDRKALAFLRQDLRASALSRVERHATRTRARFLERWFAEETQARLKALVERLTKRA